MNIHNTNYVGATGLYPQVDETVTENIIFTSNDLIRLIGNTSNNLIGYDVYNSNALANYIQYTSNALANYIVYTSNDIITSLPMSPDTYQPTVDVPPFHIPQNWDKNDFFNAGALALMNNSTFHYWRNDFNSISGDIRQHIKLLQEAIEAHEYRFCENDISAWNWELYNNALSLNRDERMRTIEAWLLGLTGASAFNLSRTLDNTLSSLLTKTDSNNSSKSLSLNLLNDDIFYIFAYPIANNTITSNFGSTQYNGILYNPNNQITSISSSHFDKSYNYINSAIPNNYISISNNILGYRMITWMNAFSISVNIKLTAYTSSIQFIKAYNNSYTFIDIGYETLSSQTYIYFKLRSYNGTILCNYSINYNMVLNTWYNISVIYHNTVSFSIYANNVNIYAEQISYVPLVWDGIVDINSLKLELFYNCRNLNVEYFRLIPRALSSVEVEKIYNVYGSIASIDEIDINQSNYVLSISNRLTDTSNLISNRLTDTSNLISNRLTDTSNLISNRLTDTSNLISNRITQQFLDLNNEINSAWNSNITGVVYNLDDKIGIGTDTLDDTTKLKVIGNTDIQGSLNIYDGGFFVNHNNNNTIPAYSSIQNFLDNYGIIDRFYVVKHNGLYDYRNNQFYNPQSDQINIIYSNEMGKYVSRLYNNPKSGFFQPHDLGAFASNRWAIAMNIKLNDNLKEFTICDIYNVSALYATIRAKADFTLNRIVLYLYTTKTLGQPMELQHSAYIKVNDAKAQHFYVFNIYGFQYSFYVDGVNVLTKNDAQIVLGVYTKVWIGNDYGSHTGSYDYSDVIICDGHNIEPVSVMIDMMNYINTLPQKPDNKIFGKTYIEYIVNEQLRLGEYNLVVSSTTTNTNRKMLQIDNDLVENDVQIINSVNNMINNTNNSGFLRYANNSIETAPTLIQQIDYNNDITNKPTIPTTTSEIAEGNNLYYTPYRVGVIASASNLHTSNYVLNTSNDLINYAISKDINVSNYVLTSSNSLINYVISKDLNVSNYVLTSSNSLINYVISKDVNVSNYVLTSSNSLINYAISKDINVSNYVLTSSNSLINYVISKDINVSNYILNTSYWNANYFSLYTTKHLMVGIGQVIPETDLSKLYVMGDIKAISGISSTNGMDSNILTEPQISFSYFQTDFYKHSIRTRHRAVDDNQNAIDFYLWDNSRAYYATGNRHKMSITAGGIGIGKTMPTEELDIVGNISISGDYKINGSSLGNNISNYVLDTSNVISNRISSLSLGSSAWITNGTSIYYNGGNVGINVYNPSFPTYSLNLTANLQINPVVRDDNVSLGGLKNYSNYPLLITNSTPSSDVILNDPQPVLGLARQGTGGKAYGSMAVFKMCRYENVGTNSRTRLDLNMYHNVFAEMSTPVITFLSGGNVGIGTTNIINTSLHINGNNVNNQLTISDSANTNCQLLLGTNHNSGTQYSTIQSILQGSAYKTLCLNAFGGNVGIGTTNAAYKLDVSGDCRINTTSGYLYAGGLRLAGWDGNSIYQNTGNLGITVNTGYNIIFSVGNGQEKMKVDSNGNVYANGLRLNGADTGNSIYQHTNNLGITVNTGNNITFSIGSGQEKMKIDSNGNIFANGLRVNGTDTGNSIFQATGALGITGNVGNPITFNFFGTGGGEKMRIQNGVLGVGLTNPNGYFKIHAGGDCYATAWVQPSDSRIKKNIVDIDDNEALEKILAIEPKKYEYIDKEKMNSNIVIGFISQQIKDVIPEATITQNEIIPNIYSTATYNSNIVYFNDDIDMSVLTSNTKVEVRVNDSKDIYIIQNVSSNYITLDKNINTSNITDECFVYGTEVDDFVALKKDVIFTLNVSATQELHRIIEKQGKEIERLSRICENLSAYVGFTI